MNISILSPYAKVPDVVGPYLFLVIDNWNDYNFYTLYGIHYVTETKEKFDLNGVKIGSFGQSEQERLLKAGDTFDNGLPDKFFSLGDTQYYERLNKLGDYIREDILFSLHDIARFPSVFTRALKEEVTKVSVMRGRTETEVTGQLRRMANGGRKLHSYDFEFESPVLPGINSKYNLSFKVKTQSTPPTNIHVLIGRNASGKTSVFNSMVSTLIDIDQDESMIGKFKSEELLENHKIFANLILISYSAFDEIGIHKVEEKDSRFPYVYIGLKQYLNSNNEIISIKTFAELTNEFIESLLTCKRNLKLDTWKIAMRILESDPNFKQEGLLLLLEISQEDELTKKASVHFSRLSSGHKIILLAVTRLVEKLEEKSLLLIDEPETHLHPPLLSSFIRVISKLLIDKNGVAIIATHSPVVLQEVPRSCVWKLRRTGVYSIAERLEIESFGENVGVLTQEIFGLEVTSSGFHELLKQLVKDCKTYEEAISKMDDEVGLEGKAILRSLFYHKNQ